MSLGSVMTQVIYESSSLWNQGIDLTCPLWAFPMVRPPLCNITLLNSKPATIQNIVSHLIVAFIDLSSLSVKSPNHFRQGNIQSKPPKVSGVKSRSFLNTLPELSHSLLENLPSTIYHKAGEENVLITFLITYILVM